MAGLPPKAWECMEQEAIREPDNQLADPWYTISSTDRQPSDDNGQWQRHCDGDRR
jgi:hypothetical protein